MFGFDECFLSLVFGFDEGFLSVVFGFDGGFLSVVSNCVSVRLCECETVSV